MFDIRSRFELRQPVMMKIDVESHEYAVIAGAAQFIARHRPVVVFECIEEEGHVTEGSHSRAAKRNIAEMGYSLFFSFSRMSWCRSVWTIFRKGHVRRLRCTAQ